MKIAIIGAAYTGKAAAQYLKSQGRTISVTTTNPSLMRHLTRTLGTTTPFLLVGGRLTYILVDNTGIF